MIEMVARDGPPTAMLCPAFICDACREQVVDQGNAFYMDRYVDGQRQTSPMFISHKQCTRRVEALLRALYPPAAGWLDMCSELKHFLPQLTNNLQHAFADDREGRYRPHDLVQTEGGILPDFRRPTSEGAPT